MRGSSITQIDAHPNKKQIISHLISKDMEMTEIHKAFHTEENPLTYDAIVYYKNKYLKNVIEEEQKKEVTTIVNEELRRLSYKYIDILDAMIAQFVESMKKGEIRVSTINEIHKIMDLVTKLKGEQKTDVHLSFQWGDKVKINPRFQNEKMKTYTDEDLQQMM